MLSIIMEITIYLQLVMRMQPQEQNFRVANAEVKFLTFYAHLYAQATCLQGES